MRISLFIAIVVMSSSLAMADQFTYTYQLAGYDYDRYEQKGAIDYDRFVKAFNEFPWVEQMRQRAVMDKGCSATIAVTDQKRDLEYWVSVAGQENEPMFLLGIVYEKETRTLFGFGKPKKVQWVEIYVAPSRASVLSTFRSFFSGNTDQLFQSLKQFDLFGQMEARKPGEA